MNLKNKDYLSRDRGLEIQNLNYVVSIVVVIIIYYYTNYFNNYDHNFYLFVHINKEILVDVDLKVHYGHHNHEDSDISNLSEDFYNNYLIGIIRIDNNMNFINHNLRKIDTRSLNVGSENYVHV